METKQHYAIPGESAQHYCISRHAPADSVIMPGANPGEYLCTTKDCEDGYGKWEVSCDDVKTAAGTKFVEVLQVGFTYNDVVYQCEDKDITQWTRGKILLDNQLKAREDEIALMKTEGTWTQEIEDALPAITVRCRALDNSMHILSPAEYTEMAHMAGTTYYNNLQTYWDDVDADEIC